MEAAAQGVQEPGTDADADLLVHTLLAAWREEKAAMREEAAAPPACNPKYSRPQPFAPGCNPMRQAATLSVRRLRSSLRATSTATASSLSPSSRLTPPWHATPP